VKVVWYVVAGVVALLVAFLWWRVTSVKRGARQRDERVLKALAPLGEKLGEGAEVAPAEIRDLCARYELRPALYGILRHFERLDLFPDSMKTWESQAEGLLAYWMMHPNELQDPPVELSVVERVERDIQGSKATFFVMKFRMAEGHWSGSDVWHLGLSGPFVEGKAPYTGVASFSRHADTLDSVSPGELVDWFMNLVTKGSG